MISAPVRYVRATSVEEALDLLVDPDAKAIAGGQSLLPVMKLRIARPSLLVDIGSLDLGGIDVRDGELHVGPLVTWAELVRAQALARPAFAAITECAAAIGDLQVRNRGTVGGSLAHADPASDMPAVLAALGAELLLRSPIGERTVEASDFAAGPFTTALVSQELIVDIVVPVPPPGSGSAYVAVEHPASGFALAGAAALVRADGTRSVALAGVGARPILLPSGTDPVGAIESIEVVGDDFAPAEDRRHLAATLAKRALERAVERTREDR